MTHDISSLKKLTIKNPTDIAALGMLAEAYRQKGSISYAIKTYNQILNLSPNNYQVLNNFGTLLRNTGDTDSSIKYLLQANSIFPNSPIILNNISDTYINMGRYDLALKTCQQASILDPNFFDSKNTMGSILKGLGQYNEAKNTYLSALKIQPNNLEIITSLAKIHYLLGEHKEAYKLIEPYLESGNLSCSAIYFNISEKINMRDDAVKRIHSILKENSKKSTSIECVQLYFCLGKHYDEISSHDEAIKHYHIGNKLINRSFNINETQHHFKALTSTYRKEPKNQTHVASNNSTQPIFIIGMPRSGTTLVEQILSSHPDVYGAGELINIDVAINQLKQNNNAFPQSLNALTSNELNSIADKYLNHISSISSNSKHVTDKMPHNFMHIGMIRRLFPSAHIIHCNRHPLDTCLSIYFSNFGSAGHNYAYNLRDLGKYYAEYMKLMTHWNECHGDNIHQIKYEDLINNQQVTSKKLFEYCNLEWNDNYLDFHNNKRTVLTFSHDQVNKPLYSTSVQRWENYENHLEVLQTILKNAITSY